MRRHFFLFLSFLPLAAQATKLADCDTQSYDVTITNAGQTHTVTLTPESGSIEEYGPVVTLKIKGRPPVAITEPHDEYCIWSGKITLQRRNVGNEAGGGGGQR